MECTRILVQPVAPDSWVIRAARGQLGPYYSRDIALRIAISEALTARRAGRPARVALDDENGRVVAERCLCERFGAANR